jgi:hypothetical protein
MNTRAGRFRDGDLSIGAFTVGLPRGAVDVAAAYTLSEILVRLPVVL